MLAAIVFLTGSVLFWHYNKIGGLQETLEEINDTREDVVFPVLRRMDRVRLQRKQVNDILAKDKEY